MLFKTIRKLCEQIDYVRREDGSWRGQFQGFCEASVSARTIEECRQRLIEVLDARLAELVGGPWGNSPTLPFEHHDPLVS